MSHITSLVLLTEHPHLFCIHSLMHTCFNVLSVCICDYKCYCGIWEAAIGMTAIAVGDSVSAAVGAQGAY